MQFMVQEGAKIVGITLEGKDEDNDPRALLAELFRRIARFKMGTAY